MPKFNLVYIFYPKGLAEDVKRSLFENVKTAETDLKRELRGASYTSSEMLSKLKTLIRAKTAGMPFTIRIATVEEAEYTPDRKEWIAEKALAWDRRVEDFICIEYPHFAKIADPEVTVVEVPTSPFTVIGFYKTVGTVPATILIGGGTALITFLISTYLLKTSWQEALIYALITGGIFGSIAYFTGKGVEAGIPVAVAK